MDVSGPLLPVTVEGVFAQGLSIFNPASPSATSIMRLAILTLAIAALIFLIVEGILVYTVFRFRQSSTQTSGEPPQVYGSMPIEVAWTAAPTMIVFFLVLVTARTLWEVEPRPPQTQPGDHTLFVTVIGHQWWWEYVYESYNGRTLGFHTANELHIPVSDDAARRPVYLSLKSADVCHSYWVPRLGGKMDLIPGHTNLMQFETRESGLHLGQCAEYCGAQHANMLIRVNAESPAEFESWLEHESRPGARDDAANEGRTAFLTQSCVNCHTVRGTTARGTYGPDLTHLMARKTLASGMLENTPENLARWVRDPQSIKPGCVMPAFGLDPRDQDLIVNYLLTLQ